MTARRHSKPIAVLPWTDPTLALAVEPVDPATLPRWYVVRYQGDDFAAPTLPGALSLATPEPGTAGAWTRVRAEDASDARLGLGEPIAPWATFTVDEDGTATLDLDVDPGAA